MDGWEGRWVWGGKFCGLGWAGKRLSGDGMTFFDDLSTLVTDMRMHTSEQMHA